MLQGNEHFYPLFRDRVQELAQCGLVLDLGTTYRFRKELEPFEALFTSKYFALDYQAQLSFGDHNVDVDGDLQRLPFATGVADGIACIEVIEHVPVPHAAIDEMYRVLKPAGLLLLTTPFLTGYHGKPGDYSDFYRYTDEGLKYLLRRFSQVEVLPLGGVLYRLAYTLTPARLWEIVTRNSLTMGLLNAVDRRRPTRSPLRWLVWAQK